jgi:hypothetical protein
LRRRNEGVAKRLSYTPRFVIQAGGWTLPHFPFPSPPIAAAACRTPPRASASSAKGSAELFCSLKPELSETYEPFAAARPRKPNGSPQQD